MIVLQALGDCLEGNFGVAAFGLFDFWGSMELSCIYFWYGHFEFLLRCADSGGVLEFESATSVTRPRLLAIFMIT